MQRADAWQIVQDHVQAAGLRRHMLAVEAAMRFYAAKLGQDPELWGMAGLLHDYDWEIHPTLEAHPKEGVPLVLAISTRMLRRRPTIAALVFAATCLALGLVCGAAMLYRGYFTSLGW